MIPGEPEKTKMEERPNCPLCSAQDWKILGTRSYVDNISDSNRYLWKRYRVLFDVWFPGNSEIILNCGMCTACGFVSLIPRVTTQDIDAKYKYLERLGQDYGTSESDCIETKRCDILYQTCNPWLNPKANVLDFGGGDGRLMASFVKHGHTCFLIDYNLTPIPGVIKLGDTTHALNDQKFDLIVCNHVIEHVADPLHVIRNLSEHLTEDGMLFIEVPMEIWLSVPLFDDPVTHCNFFVTGSLKRALELAKLNVIYCKSVEYLHPTGSYFPAVQAIAKKGTEEYSTFSSGTAEVLSNLNPSFSKRLWKSLRYKINRLLMSNGHSKQN